MPSGEPAYARAAPTNGRGNLAGPRPAVNAALTDGARPERRRGTTGAMRRQRVAASLLAGSFALTLSRNADAWCQIYTEGQQSDPRQCPTPTGGALPVAWSGACAGLSIDPRLLPEGISADRFRDEVHAAAMRWSGASCPGGGSPSFALVPYPDCPHRAEWNRSGPNSNTVSFRPLWSDDAYHPPEAIAVTITTFNPMTGEIRDADTEINLRTSTNPDGFTFTVGDAGTGVIDLPTILVHELGHSQGFAHSSDPSAVMWFETGRREQRRDLSADDVTAVCTVYPPGRSARCDPEPYRGFQCAPGCQCSVMGTPSRMNVRAALALGAFTVIGSFLARRTRRVRLAKPMT